MWQKYTCSLKKSSTTTTASSESCSATENAPGGGRGEREGKGVGCSTDKSHTFPLWCERDLKRKALHHQERLSLRSAFSTSHLNTEEEMALIMFSGVFGFGEIVSYISFMADCRWGEEGSLMSGYRKKCNFKEFVYFVLYIYLFFISLIRSLNYAWCLFYYIPPYETFTCWLLCLLFLTIS